MGLVARLLGLEQKAVSLDPATNPMLREMLGYPEAKSGFAVNWQTALNVTTVFACVQVLGNGVAQVPWRLYRPSSDGRGSVPAADHPLYKVLHRRPNPWQTSFQFRKTMVLHRALTGNFFAFVNRVGGDIRELIPIDPGTVEVIRNRDLSLTYRVRQASGGMQDLPQRDVWHLRESSWNTWTGLDAVKHAREAIGLALAAENSQALLHRNGLQTSGLYSVDGTLTAVQFRELRDWLRSSLAGANRFLPLILDRAAKFSPLSMTGVDAQHIETRRNQIEEVCRGFNVRPIMIGHSENNTSYASVEQMHLAHAVHTLAPWYEDIDQSVDVNLIGEGEEVFAKLEAKALLRAATKDRFESYARALGAGGSPAWMTVNEVRALEDLNPKEGGDELPQPTNRPAAAQIDLPGSGSKES